MIGPIVRNFSLKENTTTQNGALSLPVRPFFKELGKIDIPKDRLTKMNK